MTDQSGSAEPRPGAAPTPDATPAAPPLVAVEACPFLMAAAGAYRMSVPDREHRCAAFVPATSLALTKQARLCDTANHVGCATFIASTSARQARVGSGERIERAGRWGLARTMPVVEQVGGLRATLGALIGDRRTWPAIPAVLLATLLLALGLSNSTSPAPITAVATPTPTPRGQATPAASHPAPSASTGATPAPSATPLPTPVVTQQPGASPTPLPPYTTYKVQSGDTLYGIALQFKVTVKAIQQLNGLTGTNLHIGQVLKIPKG